MKLKEFVISRGSLDLDSTCGRWFVQHIILVDQIKDYLQRYDDRRTVYDWLVKEHGFNVHPQDLDKWLDKLMGVVWNT